MKEHVKLSHILNLIGKRMVPCYFHKHAEEQFIQWQYNACRQTAIIVAYYLQEEFPDRVISVYDAVFHDEYMGTYDHAFVFIKPSEKELGLLVDVSRVSYPTIVQRMPELRNPAVLFSNKMGYEITMERCDEISDWKKMLFSREYYTGKPYIEICTEFYHDIKRLIKDPITKQE